MSSLSRFLSGKVEKWSDKVWDGLIQTIDIRFAPLEQQLDIQKATTDAIVSRGLNVIEDQLAPVVDHGQEVLEQLKLVKNEGEQVFGEIQSRLDLGIDVSDVNGLDPRLEQLEHHRLENNNPHTVTAAQINTMTRPEIIQNLDTREQGYQKLVETTVDALRPKIEQGKEQIQALGSNIITTDTTLRVGAGGRFASIQAAWDFLQNKVILAAITIKVDDGQYTQRVINLKNQPCGNKIKIIGNVENPENCVLNFFGAADDKSLGVIVDNCHKLEFSGFIVWGFGQANNHRGLLVTNHSHLSCADNSLIFKGCKTAIEVSQRSHLSGSGIKASGVINGALITAGSSANIAKFNCTGDNRSVWSSGVQSAEGCQVFAGGAQARNFQAGFRATHSGYLWCDGAKADRCKNGFLAEVGGKLWNCKNDKSYGQAVDCTYGFLGTNNSALTAIGARVERCDVGFKSYAKSLVIANECHALNCRNYGYYANDMSLLYAWSSKAHASGNGTDYSLAAGVTGSYAALIMYS